MISLDKPCRVVHFWVILIDKITRMQLDLKLFFLSLTLWSNRFIFTHTTWLKEFHFVLIYISTDLFFSRIWDVNIFDNFDIFICKSTNQLDTSVVHYTR